MLMRDDLGVLLLGAREAIYAVDMNDISVKKAAVRRGKLPRYTFLLIKSLFHCVYLINSL